MREARANNPDLVAAERGLAARIARKKSSYNALLPRVDLTDRYSDSQGADGRWLASVQASLDVFNRAAFFEVASASAAVARAMAQEWLASVDLRFNLYSAYSGSLFADRQIEVARRIAEIRRRNGQLVALRYESGRESKGNNLRSQAERSQSEAELAQAERDLRSARAELARRLGRDDYSLVSATGALAVPVRPGDPDMPALAAANPRVLSARAERDAARADWQIVRSEFWPTVSGSYVKTFEGPAHFPEDERWAASALLRWPLLARGLTASFFDSAAARETLAQAEAALRSARQAVWSELESAWAALGGRIDQVEVTREFLEAAQQRNAEATVRYAAGLMSFEDWELAVSDLVNSEKGHLRARLDAALAGAAWDRAVGRPLEAP